MPTFHEILTAAVADISAHGYSSDAQLAEWTRKLRMAAESVVMSDSEIRQQIRAAMTATYEREVVRNGIVSMNPGVGRFTKERLEPVMRAELDRAIMANVSLIKLNQKEAVEKTLRRFTGWSTSIPKGGSRIVDKRKTKADIAKPTQQSRYEARRCTIDQGHKFVASLSEIVAHGSGAIAGVWRHVRPRPGYSPRPDHVERDQKVFLIRDSWAISDGYIKKGSAQYTDEVTKPAEEPFCSCSYRWITDLADIPDELLTERGREYLLRGANVK